MKVRDGKARFEGLDASYQVNDGAAGSEHDDAQRTAEASDGADILPCGRGRRGRGGRGHDDGRDDARGLDGPFGTAACEVVPTAAVCAVGTRCHFGKA